MLHGQATLFRRQECVNSEGIRIKNCKQWEEVYVFECSRYKEFEKRLDLRKEGERIKEKNILTVTVPIQDYEDFLVKEGDYIGLRKSTDYVFFNKIKEVKLQHWEHLRGCTTGCVRIKLELERVLGREIPNSITDLTYETSPSNGNRNRHY